MEEIVIYKYQLEVILEALRITANIHNSRKTLETCHDRQVVQAERFAENALSGKIDEKVPYGVKLKN